jgi:hypothetical protein
VKDDATAVEALFALFAGAHDLCVRLAGPPSSRGANNPHERVERALRLRLFLCVAGETWGSAPALRARALRLTYRFAKEEEVDAARQARATPKGASLGSRGLVFGGGGGGGVGGDGSTTTKPALASSPVTPPSATTDKKKADKGVPSAWLRRAPSSVHGAVDVSSWRAVAGELTKCSGAKLVPVVFALLDEQHEEEAKRRFAARSDPTRMEMDAKTTPTTTTTTTTPTPPAAEVVGSDDASSPKESSPPSPQPSLPDFIDLSGDDPATLELQTTSGLGSMSLDASVPFPTATFGIGPTEISADPRRTDGEATWERFDPPDSAGGGGGGEPGSTASSGRYPAEMNPFARPRAETTPTPTRAQMGNDEFEKIMKSLSTK